MKTATPKKQPSQKEKLFKWLKRHPKGITTMEAFEHLRITCVHKRIAGIEGAYPSEITRQAKDLCSPVIRITRTPERTASGSIVTRYKLAR